MTTADTTSPTAALRAWMATEVIPNLSATDRDTVAATFTSLCDAIDQQHTDPFAHINQSLLWDKLLEHADSHVEIAVYHAKGVDEPCDVCLEDIVTDEVILDASLYTLLARDDR